MAGRCDQRFDSMDGDHDGKLTLQEFDAVPHFRGDAKALFEQRDLDHDGAIERQEFCAGRPGASR
jgi:Ca2+-binding EF-hand superfamily protein